MSDKLQPGNAGTLAGIGSGKEEEWEKMETASRGAGGPVRHGTPSTSSA